MVKEKGNELFFCRVAKMSARVVQISDCHLFTEPEAELRGVRPHDQVRRALEHVTAHESECDLLVISGDLAHDELRPTYVVLREMLGDWSVEPDQPARSRNLVFALVEPQFALPPLAQDAQNATRRRRPHRAVLACSGRVRPFC